MESALKLQAIFRSTEPFQVFLHLFHMCAQASSARDAWEAWATLVSAAHVRSLWSVWGRQRPYHPSMAFSPSGIPCQITSAGTILLLTPKRPQTSIWWSNLLSLFTCHQEHCFNNARTKRTSLGTGSKATGFHGLPCPGSATTPTELGVGGGRMDTALIRTPLTVLCLPEAQ